MGRMKYAIKVPVDDGWLYVTETDKDGNLIAKTFDTREEAEAFEADAFNFNSLSQVVEYQEDLVDTLTEEEIEENKSADDTPVSDIVSLPPEEGITPDSWVILEVNHKGEQFQKILAGWSGGYLYGDSWRMSSPIKEMHIDIDKDYITVETDSGSVYNLRKDYQGLRMSNAGMYNRLKERFGDMVELVEL